MTFTSRVRVSLLLNRRYRFVPLLLGATVALLTLWLGLAALRDAYHLPVPATMARALSVGVLIAAAPFGGLQAAPSIPLVLGLGALVNGCVAACGGAMLAAAAGRAARWARRQPPGAHVT